MSKYKKGSSVTIIEMPGTEIEIVTFKNDNPPGWKYQTLGKWKSVSSDQAMAAYGQTKGQSIDALEALFT